MNALTLAPARAFQGEVVLPGSKSISNRALLLAALAEGKTRIRNVLEGDDSRYMLAALAQLGVEIDSAGRDHTIAGRAGPLVTAPRHERLYLGLAGTAIRPLAAALTLGAGEFELDGEPRMRERPIGHLVDALRPLGADIDYLATPGYPPIRVRGTGLAGGTTSIDGSVSSQFLTALLLTAPLARAPVRVNVTGPLVSTPYVDITLDLMARFGVAVEHDEHRVFRVPAAPYRSPGALLVEGDASAATYFLAAGAVRGTGVTVRGVGRSSVQGDVAFCDVLEAMGARVSRGTDALAVAPGRLVGIDADLNHIPDAAMTVAMLALFAEGPTTIRNIANWRVKETDRLAAMATELRKLERRAKFVRDLRLGFDGEIGEAAARIELIRRWESIGGANVQAGAARAAMIFVRGVRLNLSGGENGAEEKPGAVLA
jgi:3-phosphoshikimate 1-carboxyvinyltransferase